MPDPDTDRVAHLAIRDLSFYGADDPELNDGDTSRYLDRIARALASRIRDLNQARDAVARPDERPDVDPAARALVCQQRAEQWLLDNWGSDFDNAIKDGSRSTIQHIARLALGLDGE